MKLFISGSNGQLGWELCRRGNQYDFEILPFDLPDFDITDKENVLKTIEESNPNIVINAAAYTAVDQAEKETKTAFAVNRDGAAYLAAGCNALKIPLIHISTDYVFDGGKKEPYLETDSVSPIGIYGKSKAAGEEEIRKRLSRHIIIRTAWLYGIHGNNFVKTMLRLGKEREEIGVVNDQFGCPTFAADLAEATLKIADSIINKNNASWGTYHCCGYGQTSWFGFASEIFQIASTYESLKIKTVKPIPTSQYPTPAKRPENSVMDCTLLTQNFGIKPPKWDKSLTQMLATYFS